MCSYKFKHAFLIQELSAADNSSVSLLPLRSGVDPVQIPCAQLSYCKLLRQWPRPVLKTVICDDPFQSLTVEVCLSPFQVLGRGVEDDVWVSYSCPDVTVSRSSTTPTFPCILTSCEWISVFATVHCTKKLFLEERGDGVEGWEEKAGGASWVVLYEWGLNKIEKSFFFMLDVSLMKAWCFTKDKVVRNQFDPIPI